MAITKLVIKHYDKTPIKAVPLGQKVLIIYGEKVVFTYPNNISGKAEATRAVKAIKQTQKDARKPKKNVSYEFYF